MLDKNSFFEELSSEGFSVIDLIDPSPIFEIRDYLLSCLRDISGVAGIELETYHEYFDDDDQHSKTQFELVSLARQNRFNKKIALAQLRLFESLFGPDIAITRLEYLRIVRPNKTQDNVGYHRDLDYLNSPYELNFFIPFVDLDEQSGFSVFPGTHKIPESQIKVVQKKHPSVIRGSMQNRLGMFHSPQIIENLDVENIYTPRLKVGQSLVNFPHLVHGQEVNKGKITRWTMDMEVGNALAPLNWETTYGEPRYITIAESIFTKEGNRKQAELNNR